MKYIMFLKDLRPGDTFYEIVTNDWKLGDVRTLHFHTIVECTLVLSCPREDNRGWLIYKDSDGHEQTVNLFSTDIYERHFGNGRFYINKKEALQYLCHLDKEMISSLEKNLGWIQDALDKFRSHVDKHQRMMTDNDSAEPQPLTQTNTSGEITW